MWVRRSLSSLGHGGAGKRQQLLKQQISRRWRLETRKHSAPFFSTAAAESSDSTTNNSSTPSVPVSGLFLWGTDSKHCKIPQPDKAQKMWSVPTQILPETTEQWLGKDSNDAKIAQVVCGSTDTAIVMDNGQCFVLGENQHGQLGVGHSQPVQMPTEVKLPNGEGISQVSLGVNFAAFVSAEYGDLYTCGSNGSLVSGMGCLGLGPSVASVSTPTRVESLVQDGCAVQQAQASEWHLTVLTTESEVLTAGAGSYGRLGNFGSADQWYLEPTEVLNSLSGGHAVSAIAGGKSFTLALTQPDGLLYSWGRNHKGQLGTGLGMAVDIYAMSDIPEPLDVNNIGGSELVGQTVTQMAAGHSHAACVTAHGQVFHWGLGVHFEPVRVAELGQAHIVQVACGQDYTLAIDAAGRVYSWGAASAGMGGGTSGVLGQGPAVKRSTKATLVPEFQTSSSSSSLSLNSDNTEDTSRTPQLQPHSMQPAENVQVQQISAGWKHAACLGVLSAE